MILGAISMKIRKRRKPADPATIARFRHEARKQQRDPANWGIDPTITALPVNANIKAEDGIKSGTISRAQRFDTFRLLHHRGSLSSDVLISVDRLHVDIAIMHGVEGRSGVPVKVDCSTRDAELEVPARVKRRLAASARIDAVLLRTGPVGASLLIALSEPVIVHGRSIDWRAVVRRVTGELNPVAQTARVRDACENLMGAYSAIDRQPRQKAVAA